MAHTDRSGVERTEAAQTGCVDKSLGPEIEPDAARIRGRFRVAVPAGQTCSFEVSIVELLDTGGHRYAEPTMRIQTAVGPSVAIYRSYRHTCGAEDPDAHHRRYASVVYSLDGVIVPGAGEFSAFAGTRVAWHRDCLTGQRQTGIAWVTWSPSREFPI